MISVEQALELVLERARPQPPCRSTLGDALGRVLAEDVASDIDSPPHDKSLVDGYAVQAADLATGSAELAVLEEVTAGANPTRTVTSGSATRIMTGAPIPEGADAVVMVEQTGIVSADPHDQRVRVDGAPVRAGQNIMRRAASLARGEVVLAAGSRLRPIEIGLLAEVGRSETLVHAQPRVAVLSTGNELVPADQVPAAGQIRNSNGPLLGGLVRRAGGEVLDLGICRDERAALHASIERGLSADVLVLSGGVSAGVLDLVPQVLAAQGVEQVFHKVDLKPGKPLWFGVRRRTEGGERLVFGLPGNPVSTLVCFELFVRPALARLAGRADGGLPRRQALLATDHHHRSDRPTYFPARFSEIDGRATVAPLPWKGSADLRTLTAANCLAFFPAGEHRYRQDDAVEVVLFEA